MRIFTNIIKYLVYGTIIYTLFTYVPQKQIPFSDVSVITILLIFSFVILDLLSPKRENFYNLEQFDIPEIDDDPVEEIDDIPNEENIDDMPFDDENNILNELIENKIISNRDRRKLIKDCNENEQMCLNNINQMKSNRIINDDQYIKLLINFGISKFKFLKNLIDQKRLNMTQALELGIAISHKLNPITIVLLENYVDNNILSKQDSEQLISDLKISNDYQNIGITTLSNLLENNILNTRDVQIINNKCSSSSMDACSIKLNEYVKNKKILNNTQAIEILKAYNKPGINEYQLDNSNFGSISNESDLGSLNLNDNFDKINTKKPKKDIENSTQTLINKDPIFNDNYVNLFNGGDKVNIDYGNDMQFSENPLKYHEPLGKYNKDFNNKFNNNKDYLDSNKWKPVDDIVLQCKNNDDCNTCNNNFIGYPLNVKQWDKSRKIMAPDNINVSYINKRLNQTE